MLGILNDLLFRVTQNNIDTTNCCKQVLRNVRIGTSLPICRMHVNYELKWRRFLDPVCQSSLDDCVGINENTDCSSSKSPFFSL
ncbi:hypothetical protein E2C01_081414 [Portunus trituberculatus]|uniref:Uncharacterized protein n=1 Tax=Portunus trituberculatus TaxID=210409 RepID=A0A5B7IPQ1_PORTR|nr:hypothetical protein [Portunus trituberculatus]